MNKHTAQTYNNSGPTPLTRDILKWAGHTEGSACLETVYSTVLDAEIAANYLMRLPQISGDAEK